MAYLKLADESDEIEISLSHEKEYAIAMAIMNDKEGVDTCPAPSLRLIFIFALFLSPVLCSP